MKILFLILLQSLIIKQIIQPLESQTCGDYENVYRAHTGRYIVCACNNVAECLKMFIIVMLLIILCVLNYDPNYASLTPLIIYFCM